MFFTNKIFQHKKKTFRHHSDRVYSALINGKSVVVVACQKEEEKSSPKNFHRHHHHHRKANKGEFLLARSKRILSESKLRVKVSDGDDKSISV